MISLILRLSVIFVLGQLANVLLGVDIFNLLLVAVIAVSLRWGAMTGFYSGLYSAVLMEIIFGRIGVGFGLLCLTGVLAGYFKKRLFFDSLITQWLLSFGVCFVTQWIRLHTYEFSWELILAFIAQSLWAGLISPLIFAFFSSGLSQPSKARYHYGGA